MTNAIVFQEGVSNIEGLLNENYYGLAAMERAKYDQFRQLNLDTVEEALTLWCLRLLRNTKMMRDIVLILVRLREDLW